MKNITNPSYLLFVFITPAVLFLSGCSARSRRRTSADFAQLSIGMTKEQVRDVLGTPDEVRGSTADQAGNITSVWSYNVYRKGK